MIWAGPILWDSMPEMKRVNLFCGHYGSGKTNTAINFAEKAAESGLSVVLADVDIVNPYFRSKDSEERLRQKGVEVISLPFANSNVDLPALPPEVYSLVQNREKVAVFDVGGDDRGAYALGRYAPYILEENDYSMFFTVNFCRPLTTTAEQALEVLREIECACGVPFTAIVNNSNLGDATDIDTVRHFEKEAERLSALASLPLAFTCVREELCREGDGYFPLRLQEKLF